MRAARERHRDEIVPLEGEEMFARFQDFLDVTARLAAERRLSRWVYLARKG
jgi:hypothetical protein